MRSSSGRALARRRRPTQEEKPPPIADARRAAGLSQRELAERIGVSLWVLERMERGDKDPRPHLNAIAEATGQPAAPTEDAPAETPESTVSRRSLWVRNLVLFSVVALVTVRFFTEEIAVLPRALKLLDIPILLVLLVVAARTRRDANTSARSARYLLPAILFFGLCTASVLANTDRIAPAPVLLFMYGFLSPIAIFYVVRSVWPTGNALACSRVLVALAYVEFAVVLFSDLPEYLEIENPDVVSGTFGENAYQLVFFLLMCTALVAGIATVERKRPAARLAPVFFAATAATILFAQYRAILLTAILTLVLLGALMGMVRVRGAFAGVLAIVTLGLGLSVIPSIFPELKLEKTISTLTGNPSSYATERLKAGSDVADLYTDEPAAILFGSGPGTFNSRAWETFADAPTKSSASLGVNLPFTDGRTGYRTDVSEKYTLPRVRAKKTVEGSFALASPYASYYALLAEVGVVGLVLMLLIYGRALMQSIRMSVISLRNAPDGDPLPGLLLASTAGFFVIIQMGILENWWEVTRVTFILWTIFAVASKEFEARYLDGSPEPAVTA